MKVWLGWAKKSCRLRIRRSVAVSEWTPLLFHFGVLLWFPFHCPEFVTTSVPVAEEDEGGYWTICQNKLYGSMCCLPLLHSVHPVCNKEWGPGGEHSGGKQMCFVPHEFFLLGTPFSTCWFILLPHLYYLYVGERIYHMPLLNASALYGFMLLRAKREVKGFIPSTAAAPLFFVTPVVSTVNAALAPQSPGRKPVLK